MASLAKAGVAGQSMVQVLLKDSPVFLAQVRLILIVFNVFFSIRSTWPSLKVPNSVFSSNKYGSTHKVNTSVVTAFIIKLAFYVFNLVLEFFWY